MKSNTFYSLTHLLESLVIAIFIILVTAIATAEAHNNPPRVPDSTLNGLFTPTAADRFFQAGREDFEQEIDFLTNPERYLDGDLLKMDPELKEQMQETKTLPDFDRDNFQMSE